MNPFLITSEDSFLRSNYRVIFPYRVPLPLNSSGTTIWNYNKKGSM